MVENIMIIMIAIGLSVVFILFVFLNDRTDNVNKFFDTELIPSHCKLHTTIGRGMAIDHQENVIYLHDGNKVRSYQYSEIAIINGLPYNPIHSFGPENKGTVFQIYFKDIKEAPFNMFFFTSKATRKCKQDLIEFTKEISSKSIEKQHSKNMILDNLNKINVTNLIRKPASKTTSNEKLDEHTENLKSFLNNNNVTHETVRQGNQNAKLINAVTILWNNFEEILGIERKKRGSIKLISDAVTPLFLKEDDQYDEWGFTSKSLYQTVRNAIKALKVSNANKKVLNQGL